MKKQVKLIILVIILLILFGFSIFYYSRDLSPQDNKAEVSWTMLSSKAGQLPVPKGSQQQTASLILDINKDGINDFVIASRDAANSVVWYQRTQSGWQQFVIDSENLPIEAGGDFFDIDNDGDLDVSFAGDNSSNKIYWWENPYPNYAENTKWNRYTIKTTGSNKHHDQAFGDVDGDGKTELVFWNQKGTAPGLFVAEIPSDPKSSTEWTMTKIFNSTDKHEGLAIADIDLDGKLDIVGAGLWFKHTSGTNYQKNIIDETRDFTRVAVGQLKKGERPEVVFSAGDTTGTADKYQWNGSTWVKTKLFDVKNGHSLQILDVNKDGNMDLFSAEMRLAGANPESKVRILYGDGNGNMTTTVVKSGLDVHEGKMADLDGDGDFDILAKPYNFETPNIAVLLQEGGASAPTSTPVVGGGGLDSWERKLVGEVTDRNILAVTAVNVDGDSKKDIVTGDSWWKQPTTLTGNWTKNEITNGFDNFFYAGNFGGDNKLDLIGSRASASSTDANRHNSRDLVWAKSENNSFTLMNNIQSPTVGDFPQGVKEIQIGSDNYLALSWHKPATHDMQFLKVSGESTNWSLTTPTGIKSQNEGLAIGDIDGDGDDDIFQGTKWIRNNGAINSLTQHVVDNNLAGLTAGIPDRVVLKNFRGGNLLDAVVSLENGNEIIYYKNPGGLENNPNQTWTRTIIYSISGEGFSMDSGDIDNDGDFDIVLGEHKGATNNRVIILENKDKTKSDQSNNWTEHIVDSQSKNIIDHHVGTQLVDIDDDGDLDIISIGWFNRKAWLFVNGSDSTYPSNTPVTQATNTPTPIVSTPTITPSDPPVSGTVSPSATPTIITGNICGKADVDNNGQFTIFDFSEFAKTYGRGTNTCADKDVDYGPCGGRDVTRDGKLNIADFGAQGIGFAQRYYPKTSCAL